MTPEDAGAAAADEALDLSAPTFEEHRANFERLRELAPAFGEFLIRFVWLRINESWVPLGFDSWEDMLSAAGIPDAWGRMLTVAVGVGRSRMTAWQYVEGAQPLWHCVNCGHDGDTLHVRVDDAGAES